MVKSRDPSLVPPPDAASSSPLLPAVGKCSLGLTAEPENNSNAFSCKHANSQHSAGGNTAFTDAVDKVVEESIGLAKTQQEKEEEEEEEEEGEGEEGEGEEGEEEKEVIRLSNDTTKEVIEQQKKAQIRLSNGDPPCLPSASLSGNCQVSQQVHDVVVGPALGACERRATLESFAKDSSCSTPNPSFRVRREGGGGGRIAHTRRCPPYGITSVIGRRPEMEDEVAVQPSFVTLPAVLAGGVGGGECIAQSENSEFHFFGVFDGHGGAQVAKFCKEQLHRSLNEELQSLIRTQAPTSSTSVDHSWQGYWQTAFHASFLRTDAEVRGEWQNSGLEGSTKGCMEAIAPDSVGATAVVAVVGPSHIIVANCGDSRAVLSRRGRAIPLSTDHKPDREDEMHRIEAAGGRVICWNGYRVLGVLAMSRAIGDGFLKPYVIADPEITFTQRTEDDECLILASDGLWDVLSNDEVCEIARRRLSRRHCTAIEGSSSSTPNSRSEGVAEAAASFLTRKAIAHGSNDNISVVVVDLKYRRAHIL